jgi:hypothetical protein
VKRAGDLLSSFISEHFDQRFMEKARGYSAFFSSWAPILEAERVSAAADHSRIVELERHVVLVEADHPGWVQILQTKQKEILEAFQRRFPAFAIRGIAFRYASDPAPGPSKVEPEKPPVETAPEAPPEIALSPGSIKDQELLDSLNRLKQGIMARERRPS